MQLLNETQFHNVKASHFHATNFIVNSVCKYVQNGFDFISSLKNTKNIHSHLYNDITELAYEITFSTILI